MRPLILILILGVAAFPGCGDFFQPLPATFLDAPAAISLLEGSTTVVPVLTDACRNGLDPCFTWSSSNPCVVSTDRNTTFAWRPGTAVVTVYATFESHLRDSIVVTVTPRTPRSVVLGADSVAVAPGAYTDVPVTVTDGSGVEFFPSVTYTSLDTTVARIDHGTGGCGFTWASYGRIRGVGPGTTLVVAALDSLSDTVRVTVF